MSIAPDSYSRLIPLCASLALAIGCSSASPTAPTPSAASPATMSSSTSGAATHNSTAGHETGDNCTFDRGTTTCVTTVTHTEADTHQAYSGCLYGPFRQPGRRVRTFEDTYLVTETTTTLQHGRNGAVYDSQIETTRQLMTSRQISDVCEPL